MLPRVELIALPCEGCNKKEHLGNFFPGFHFGVFLPDIGDGVFVEDGVKPRNGLLQREVTEGGDESVEAGLPLRKVVRIQPW